LNPSQLPIVGRHDGADLGSDALTPTKLVTLAQVRQDPTVEAYIFKANEQMAAIGYTEHGKRHASIVAGITRTLCIQMGRGRRQAEVAAIAGYLHDVGNMVHRSMHPQIGGAIAIRILDRLGMDPLEIGSVAGAIGNHEETDGIPVSVESAAVILADKSDVHFSRVQNPDRSTYDIHDRVNDAVRRSRLRVDDRPAIPHSAAEAADLTDNVHGHSGKIIRLELTIDTSAATVMEYFEIFSARMVMCRKAAELLGARFHLEINGVDL
jgi:metal-dependent HD superfamily phosphatase/phosphodiesterase